MRYTVVSAHKGMHGSFMNLLDVADYLIRQGHEVDFVCLSMIEFCDTRKLSLRKYQLQRIYDIKTLDFTRLTGIALEIQNDPKKLSNGNVFRRNETVITDFKSLISWPTTIICNKLVILDNAELSYHLNGTVIDFYPKDIGDIRTVLKRHNYKDHIFCMPPCNYDQFTQRYPDLNARIFFKKINIEALCTARASDNGKFFYRGHNPPEGLLKLAPTPVLLDDLTQMFNYKNLH